MNNIINKSDNNYKNTFANNLFNSNPNQNNNKIPKTNENDEEVKKINENKGLFDNNITKSYSKDKDYITNGLFENNSSYTNPNSMISKDRNSN
jgi:hypothetical protein